MDRDLFGEWSIVRFRREWERTGRSWLFSGCVRSALLQRIPRWPVWNARIEKNNMLQQWRFEKILSNICQRKINIEAV